LVDRDLAALPARAPACDSIRFELHRFGDERVEILDAAARTVTIEPAAEQLTEMVVLDGCVVANGRRLDRLGWARLPVGRALTLEFERNGRVWLKRRPRVATAVAVAAHGRMNA
jgi:hypothetical protein